MKKFILFLMFFGGSLYADEQVSLNTPLVVNPTQLNSVTISTLILDVTHSKIIIILTDGSNTKEFEYVGAIANTLLHQLNNGNFSATSLEKAIFNKLIADGLIVGTVSGTPL